mmetsp:Transcript_34327/g.91779  ORF Transcript_34327/g.91779 Transcript_34327/m.91779 type:complete len:200 (+) Transcript_34327:984-1583(+)
MSLSSCASSSIPCLCSAWYSCNSEAPSGSVWMSWCIAWDTSISVCISAISTRASSSSRRAASPSRTCSACSASTASSNASNCAPNWSNSTSCSSSASCSRLSISAFSSKMCSSALLQASISRRNSRSTSSTEGSGSSSGTSALAKCSIALLPPNNASCKVSSRSSLFSAQDASDSSSLKDSPVFPNAGVDGHGEYMTHQ